MLTIVIPAFNEEAIIRHNVLAAREELDRIAGELAIEIALVVLDDGSTDATKQEVMAAQDTRPGIGYEWRPGPSRRENLASFLATRSDPYVGWMDADLSTDLSTLGELVRSSFDHDIVTGSRYLPSSSISRAASRLVISGTYNRLVRVLFNSKIRDHWCGFKIFRREALVEILGYIGENDTQRQMFWDAEMWICAQRLGLSILEVPVAWVEGDKSALSWHTELPMAAHTARYWVSGRWRRPRTAAIQRKILWT